MALDTPTNPDEHHDNTSAQKHDDEGNIETVPMKCHEQRVVKPSKRASWKFDTDWSFRSGNSSILTGSFNSWYHILDIEEDDDDEEDMERTVNRAKTTSHSQTNRHLSKDKSFKASFKRSVHSTIISDELQTSFQSSMGNDHSDDDNIGDMNEYLDMLKGLGEPRSETAMTSNVNDPDTTATAVRTCDDTTAKSDGTDLFYCLTEFIDKEQWDTTGRQGFNQDSDKKKGKARAA